MIDWARIGGGINQFINTKAETQDTYVGVSVMY